MLRYAVMAKLTWFHLNREISCHSSDPPPHPLFICRPKIATPCPNGLLFIYGQGPVKSINLSAAGNVPDK